MNRSSVSLNTACVRIEKSSQCFDGHRQLPVRRTPWEGSVGFDLDEVEHERILNLPTGRDYVLTEDMPDCENPDCCSCHICDPREELECKDMLEAIRQGLVTLAYAIKELGEVFRRFLEIEDPELAELAIAY